MSKPFVFSYSFINTYLTCPRQAQAKYITKELPYVESDAMKWGNKVHSAFEQRINNRRMLPSELAAWEPLCLQLELTPVQAEVKLGTNALGAPQTFFGDHVWLRGVIDVQKVQGNVAVILDWKTGKVREDPLELEVFGLLLRQHNPEVEKVTGNYIWMQTGKIGDVHELSDRKRTWDFVRRTSDEIDTLKKHVGDGQWPAKQNGLCKAWCDVLSCPYNGKRK
jgi:hypothetical protein